MTTMSTEQKAILAHLCTTIALVVAAVALGAPISCMSIVAFAASAWFVSTVLC